MMFPKSERAGIIDIGSNSVRLVIYDVLGASILQTFNEKVMAGLGEGLIQRGTLSPTGREAALSALSRYLDFISMFQFLLYFMGNQE